MGNTRLDYTKRKQISFITLVEPRMNVKGTESPLLSL